MFWYNFSEKMRRLSLSKQKKAGKYGVRPLYFRDVSYKNKRPHAGKPALLKIVWTFYLGCDKIVEDKFTGHSAACTREVDTELLWR